MLRNIEENKRLAQEIEELILNQDKYKAANTIKSAIGEYATKQKKFKS